MNHLAFIKNEITGEVYDTKAKILKLHSSDNLSFVVSPDLDNANWETEPPYPLHFIYRLRAEQIGQQNDYIVFYFSGGSDSITALNAFVKNNIHIDEVVVYINTDSDDLKVNNLYAITYLKSIGYKGFVNVVDLNYSMLSNVLEQKHWKDYENYSGLLHSFYRWRIDFYENYGHLAKRERPEKTSHIFSGWFPYIHKDGKDYYSRLSIRNVMHSDSNPENIQFFTCNEFPQVHIKQSHILARYMFRFKKEYENFDNESKKFKLTIRDEYVDEINTPKGRGKTKDMAPGSAHEILFKLYSDKEEFVKNYGYVLEHFNSFDMINLEQFNKDYFLFSEK